MLDKIKSNFNTQTWVLIPIAIAINIAVGQIVLVLKLPVFLDSIGTVLVAVLCGPWAGALTGTLSNVIWGIAIDPGAFPWWPVAAMIGYMAGRMAQWGFFKSWWKVVVTGLVIALTAAIVSTLEAEFGETARARRDSLHERASQDASLRAHTFAVMAGPEVLPPEIFTPEHRARVLGEA